MVPAPSALWNIFKGFQAAVTPEASIYLIKECGPERSFPLGQMFTVLQFAICP